MNRKEIRIFAIPRSGHNAVMFWIADHLFERPCVLSKPAIDRNLFLQFDSRSFSIPRNVLSGLDLAKERAGLFSPKCCLLYDIERLDLAELKNTEIERNHDACLGTSASRYDVLVLRDPFNLLASALRFYENSQVCLRGLPGRALGARVSMWKQYAREFLGETHYLTQTKIAVSYNSWLLFEKERRRIADVLGLERAEDAVTHVPSFGGGSSFDRMRYQTRAGEMKTLERWSHYANSALFRSVLDEELFELSRRIFGELKGTETLYPARHGSRRGVRREEIGIFVRNRAGWMRNRTAGNMRKASANLLLSLSRRFPKSYLFIKNLFRKKSGST